MSAADDRLAAAMTDLTRTAEELGQVLALRLALDIERTTASLRALVEVLRDVEVDR